MHLDARTQTALAREHAERLRQTMHAGRRPQPVVDRNDADHSGAAQKEPASLRLLANLQRTAP